MQVAQADAAELERRNAHSPPQLVQVGDDAQLDAGRGVPCQQVAERRHRQPRWQLLLPGLLWYQNAIGGQLYYSVMPAPDCSGYMGSMTAFEALTSISAGR